MNRKSFSLASLALLISTLLPSCSADEELSNLSAPSADSSAIVFRVDNATSARTSTRDISTSVTDFKVSAFDGGTEYFSTPLSVFSSDNGSTWTSSSKTYWPTDLALTFVAYVDRNPNGNSFLLESGSASFDGYEVPSNVADHSDLMYAVAKDVTRTSSASGVSLRFRHALSQVSFTVQNNSPVYESIEVLSIELGGVKGKGTYNFPQASTNSTARGEWTVDTNSDDRSYTIGGLGITLGECAGGSYGEKVSIGNCTRGEDGNVMYLIPQDVEEGAYIKVRTKMTLKDVPGASYESEEIIPITVDWKEGQKYSYNIAWNATPITFDVKVADFREVTVSAE